MTKAFYFSLWRSLLQEIRQPRCGMWELASFLAYAKVTSVASSQLLFLDLRKVNVDIPCCLFFPSSFPCQCTLRAQKGLWKLTGRNSTGWLSSDPARKAKLTLLELDGVLMLKSAHFSSWAKLKIGYLLPYLSVWICFSWAGVSSGSKKGIARVRKLVKKHGKTMAWVLYFQDWHPKCWDRRARGT